MRLTSWWLLSALPSLSSSTSLPVNGTRGIDLFEIHLPVNWKNAVADGVEFVFVKATEGINYKNPRYPSQTENAAPGVLHGAIHFASAASSSGADQARFFLNNGGNWTADGETLPGVLEMEGNIAGKLCHGMEAEEITDWMADFSNTYKQATGRPPLLFLSAKWWGQCAGNDTSFAAEQEDVTQPPNSGRRFRSIFRLMAPQRHPYVSVDFHNIDLETWLAVITRDGFLRVMEPVSPDSLADWQTVDEFRVCTAPQRGEETSFKVQFHHDPTDITHSILPSWDRKSLSLVVAAMDGVKIFRTDANRRFYHAIELTGHGGLVRDISWANGSVRGYDLIASGCKDGFVRVFEVYTSLSSSSSRDSDRHHTQSSTTSQSSRTTAQSGIGSALASRAPMSINNRPATGDSPFKHSFKEVACIDSKHLDVWQVGFSYAGDCLISSGDDGVVRFWKKALSGEWLEYAETEMTDQENK